MQVLSGDARRAVFAPLDDGALRSAAVVRRVGSAIALGLLGDGEQLPSETELALMLNVSTVTLRDALADLRLRGLVVALAGVVAGIALAAGLTRLAVGAVRAGASLTEPRPPLVTVVPWGGLLLWAAAVLAALGAASWIASARSAP